MIAADGLFTDRLDQIVALTQRYSVPTMLAASTAAITREPAPQKREILAASTTAREPTRKRSARRLHVR
jgi:hypothetical protein